MILNDAQSGVASALASTGFDVNALTIGSGANRALVVSLGWLATVTSVTVIWDPTGTNQSLTLIKTDVSTNARMASIYGLVAPTSGNKTLRIAWTTSTECALNAFSYTGVDQTGGTTTFPNSGSATGTSTTPAITTTTKFDRCCNSVIASGAAQALNSTSPAPSWLYHGTGLVEIGGSRPLSTSSSISFTGTLAGSDQWVIVATDIVEFIPAAPANSVFSFLKV